MLSAFGVSNLDDIQYALLQPKRMTIFHGVKVKSKSTPKLTMVELGKLTNPSINPATPKGGGTWSILDFAGAKGP